MANSGVGISNDLIMPREQVKESSWMSPSAARIAWDGRKDMKDETKRDMG